MCSTNKTSISDNIVNSSAIKTSGIHHLGLTVPNIKETAAFFIEHLNFKQVGEKPDYPAIFVSDGSVMLTLWQIKNADNMIGFDRENNVGLHHFALKIATSELLQATYEYLNKVDNVVIEFAPEVLASSPFQHMMCLIPGGIRLELISG